MVSIQDPGTERSVQRIEIRGRVSLRPQHVAPSLEVRQIISRAKIPDPAVEVLLLVAPQPELLADLADFDTVRMRPENREEPAVDRSQGHQRILSCREALSAWGAANGRHYPWRQESGYRLAVAEVLLQKTRGGAVEPVWQATLQRFPDAASLTGPGADELLELMAPLGLGAQRVARLRTMAAHFDAGSPGCPPGMGPYGYGVVVLASGQIPEVAPVDGNLARVVSRVNGWRFERGEARKKPESRAAVRELLAGVRAAERLAILYALVDVGATLCKRVHPDCVRCPLQSSCVWAQQPARGDQKVQ